MSICSLLPTRTSAFKNTAVNCPFTPAACCLSNGEMCCYAIAATCLYNLHPISHPSNHFFLLGKGFDIFAFLCTCALFLHFYDKQFLDYHHRTQFTGCTWVGSCVPLHTAATIAILPYLRFVAYVFTTTQQIYYLPAHLSAFWSVHLPDHTHTTTIHVHTGFSTTIYNTTTTTYLHTPFCSSFLHHLPTWIVWVHTFSADLLLLPTPARFFFSSTCIYRGLVWLCDYVPSLPHTYFICGSYHHHTYLPRL